MLISNLQFLFCAFLYERTSPNFFWEWGIYVIVSVWLGYARCPFFNLDIAVKVVFRHEVKEIPLCAGNLIRTAKKTDLPRNPTEETSCQFPACILACLPCGFQTCGLPQSWVPIP